MAKEEIIIKKEDGKEVAYRTGNPFGDIKIGELHEKLGGTKETRNAFGPNVRVNRENDLFPNTPRNALYNDVEGEFRPNEWGTGGRKTRFHPNEKLEEKVESPSQDSNPNYYVDDYPDYVPPPQWNYNKIGGFFLGAMLFGLTILAMKSYYSSPEYFEKQQIKEQKMQEKRYKEYIKSTAFKRGEKFASLFINNPEYTFIANRKDYPELFSHLDKLIDSGTFDDNRNKKISNSELEKIANYASNVCWNDKNGNSTSIDKIAKEQLTKDRAKQQELARIQEEIARKERLRQEAIDNEEVTAFSIEVRGKKYVAERKSYPDLFERIDLNKNGKFERKEHGKIIPLLKRDITVQINGFYEVDSIISTFMLPLEMYPQEKEVTSVFFRVGDKYPRRLKLIECKKEDYSDFFDKIDLNRDGKVTYREFGKCLPSICQYSERRGYNYQRKRFFDEYSPPKHLYTRTKK